MIQAASLLKTLRLGIARAALFVSIITVSRADTFAETAPESLARGILQATGTSGGLIVHLGCGDGNLTAALHVDRSYLIHGLDTEADLIRQAREHIQAMGLYGPVSVDRFDGSRLPHADNLVNLVVAEELGNVTTEEAMRVLAPGGTLYAKQDGVWKKTVKPRPENIDEWTHFLHDASGNAVAHDELVGPPGSLQWNAEPRFTRSHEHIPGINALVSTGGRIFYIVDEAPVASMRCPSQWQLVARDAFNGIMLWKRPIETWYPHIVNWGQTPRQLQRKLIAVGDRVYVTLGLHAPLTAVDSATGETVRVYENTEGAEEIIFHQGVLLVAVRSVDEERAAEIAKWAGLLAKRESPLHDRDTAEPLIERLRMAEAKGQKSILALNADSGSLLWKKTDADVSGLRTQSLCADDGRVFYQNGSNAVCLDLKSGRELWSTSATTLRLVSGGSVFCAGGKTVAALSAESGKTLWTQTPLLTEIRDTFVAGGALWLGGFKPFPTKRGPSWGPYFATRRDLDSGEVLMHVEPENPSHHHRCYQNKATDRYILGGRRGTEFIDLESGEVLWNSWARGVCKYGVMPCNGLLYAPSHACGCYMTAKLTGFNALVARKNETPTPGDEPGTARLETGPAYKQSINRRSSIISSPDWPTYRFDAERSGCSPTAVPANLRKRWQTNLGGKITALTVADGKVFVALPDQHGLTAMDADSGQAIWNFTAGARIDSPPTVSEGRAIFGSHDGYVYSLETSKGQLAWRVQAARKSRYVTVRGQLESALPVIGSVLVDGGVAYATAGRSSYMDGGIDLYRLEAASGKTLSRTPIYSPDPQTGRQPKQSAPAFMPGTRADILSLDDGHVYLRDTVFDKRGVALPEGSPHLFTMTDFLDDSWPHRSYWIFGTECSVSTGCSGRDRNLIFGRLLLVDESTIYGFGRGTVHWSNHLQDGPYRLFAVNRDGGEKQWAKPMPILVRAMLRAGKVIFTAGPTANIIDGSADPDDNPETLLVAISAADGTELGRCKLDCVPIFDGMAAAGGRLYISLENGDIVCMDEG